MTIERTVADNTNRRGCEFADLYYTFKFRKKANGLYHCANMPLNNSLPECPFECCIKEELRGKERLAHLAEKLLTLLE
ncbi:MAG: hypothetical protein WC479_11370 [Candidatus Izemoplasmatales bacterium]|jgi:hypothetical protein|nr:hypothetical protein KKB3_00688 [Dehalococcoides mccartyi]